MAAVPWQGWHSKASILGVAQCGKCCFPPNQENLAFSCLSAQAFLISSSVFNEFFAEYVRKQITWRKSSCHDEMYMSLIRRVRDLSGRREEGWEGSPGQV